jgi:tetratricopeptide (TPR) repeat protein
MAVVLLLQEQAESALPFLSHLLQISPDDIMALNNMGRALNELGRSEEAVPHLKHSLSLKPGAETPMALFEMAHASATTWKIDESTAMVQNAPGFRDSRSIDSISI